MIRSRGALGSTLRGLVSAAALAGCAGPHAGRIPAASVETTPASPTCAGTRYVEVRNNLQTRVEVYAYTAEGGSPRFLGNVGPGTQRLPLLQPVGHIYAEAGGRRLTGRPSAHGMSGGVTFAQSCDSR